MGRLFYDYYDHQIGVYHIIKTRFKFIALGLLSALFLFLIISKVNAASSYSNGFETNTDDWSATETTRVSSGTDGIPSADGSYHAEVTSGAFTRWGGYESIFPANGYTTTVDVYLDMSMANGSDKRFDFSSAINDPSGNHRRDFIIHLGTNPSEPGQWAVSASNNAPGWPLNPARNPQPITETGWYTVKHEFRNNGSGVLEVEVSLLKKSNGSVVGSWVLSDNSDVIDSTVGGHRYGWFTPHRFDFTSVAIDNATLLTEPVSPDPTNSHQFNVSGNIYRDVALNDCDNKSECENRAEKLPDWEARLYKENSSGSWDLIDSDITDASGEYKFATQYEAGVYHTCEVLKAGWTQQKQTWSGSGYKVDTDNLSGDSSEGPYCNTLTYDDTHDRSSKAHIGNVDTTKPFTEVLSPDEDGAYKSTLNINIRATDNESGIVQAVANLYDSSGFLSPCVNENVSPPEAQHDFICSIDTTTLDDGEYYIKTNAKDAGNKLSNTVTWNFTIDNTPPVVTVTPVAGSLLHGTVTFNITVIDNNLKPNNIIWTYLYNASPPQLSKGANVNLSSGHGTFTVDTKLLNDGNAVLDVGKLYDAAGNPSGIGDTYFTGYIIDNTPPAIPTLLSPSDGVPVNGTAPIANDWEDVAGADHYIYQSYNVDSNGDCILSPPRFTSTYSDSQTNSRTLPNGLKFCWRVKSVDNIGNESDWSEMWMTIADNVGPSTPVNGLPNGTYEPDNIFNFTWDPSADNIGPVTYEYQTSQNPSQIGGVLNSGVWHNTSSSDPAQNNLTTSMIPSYGAPDGTWYWQVRAKDAAGNYSAWSDIWEMTIDSVAPSEPTANPPAGDYTGPQDIELSSSDSISGLDKIYYTLDGSEPNNITGTEYTGLIPITDDTTLKAIAYDNAGHSSSVLTAEYGIAPIISEETSADPITTESITITWITDKPATSRVIYDTVPHATLDDSLPNYGYAESTPEDSTKVISHSVTVTGLAPGTTYYFRTVSHGSPESVSNEIVATTNDTPPQQTNSNNNSSSNSNSGNTTTTAFNSTAFNTFGTFGTTAPDNNGNVLSANDDNTDGTTEEDNGGSVQADSAGLSSAVAAPEASGKFTWSWWWILPIIAVLLLIFALWRRREAEEEA